MNRLRTIPVSVIVLAKNEEPNLEFCLRSVDRFSEVVVVDSRSTDRTAEIAIEAGARLVPFEWNGRYPKKKQWALENIVFANDWLLYVDADEQVTGKLADEIARVVANPGRHHAYWVTYDYVFLGRPLRHGVAARKVVLLRRDRARFPEIDDLGVAHMWEVEGHYQPVIEGSIGQLRSRMIHDDHESLFHYFDRHNRYSDWEGDIRTRRRVQVVVTHNATRSSAKSLFDRLPMRWFWFFWFAFVARGGFLDGMPGFHYAMAKSFYYWQIDVKARDASRRQSR